MPIKHKVGTCTVCQSENVMLMAKKCLNSPNYCYQKSRQKTVSPIRKTSKKLATKLIEYKKAKTQFLTENNICAFPGCESTDVQLHHAKGRCGALLIDVNHFRALCDTHHRYVEENPVMAKEMGLSGDRL